MKTKEKPKFLNNTVYVKNRLITCLLILKDVNKDTVFIDCETKELINDIRNVLNDIITEDKEDWEA
jgi:hypothetical protein